MRSRWSIKCGDALHVLREMDGDSFSGCLCDPPYGLGFMGKAWDHGVPSADVWSEVLRVLKPGSHLLAFGGTRTFHRLTCAIEDAGFEIRDCLMWLYGSGFPKSHNFGRSVPGFDGYGTALKPAWEPCIVAMKPADGTFAQNALEHGVAGLNIEAGRIGSESRTYRARGMKSLVDQHSRIDRPYVGGLPTRGEPEKNVSGRWPANLILNESFEQEWARFFYCAKASRRERDAGLDGFEAKAEGHAVEGFRDGSLHKVNTTRKDQGPSERQPTRNFHPCLKPMDLCRYLASLILPPKRDTSRRILTPFSGSGSEMIGALMAGWDEAVGIEMSDEYCKVAEARISHWIDGLQCSLFDCME